MRVLAEIQPVVVRVEKGGYYEIKLQQIKPEQIAGFKKITKGNMPFCINNNSIIILMPSGDQIKVYFM